VIHVLDSKQLKKKTIYLDKIDKNSFTVLFYKPLCSLVSKLYYFFVALFVANPITINFLLKNSILENYNTEINIFHSKNQHIQLCPIQNLNL